LQIPKEFREAIWQHKRYRYEKNSDKPLKEDDHHPDATMLALRRWMLGKSISKFTDDYNKDLIAHPHIRVVDRRSILNFSAII